MKKQYKTNCFGQKFTSLEELVEDEKKYRPINSLPRKPYSRDIFCHYFGEIKGGCGEKGLNIAFGILREDYKGESIFSITSIHYDKKTKKIFDIIKIRGRKNNEEFINEELASEKKQYNESSDKTEYPKKFYAKYLCHMLEGSLFNIAVSYEIMKNAGSKQESPYICERI
ncbi:MAG: hypothetical protein WC413_03690 [Candidatus Nanoarchaeia archaeon]